MTEAAGLGVRGVVIFCALTKKESNDDSSTQIIFMLFDFCKKCLTLKVTMNDCGKSRRFIQTVTKDAGRSYVSNHIQTLFQYKRHVFTSASIRLVA
jgi:hypothetical protein